MDGVALCVDSKDENGKNDPQKIIDFVSAVTDSTGRDYVEPGDRIATFDNDGTLWVEYPIYIQLLFALERVKQLESQHPEWSSTQPFKAALEGDMPFYPQKQALFFQPGEGRYSMKSTRWLR